MANKYCGNCGTEIPEGARFCLNCGQSFEPVDSIHNSKKEHKENKKSLYALAVILGILLLIIAGAMYYADYTDRKEARIAREKFVADSLETARQDSLVQLNKEREKEKQEAIAAQKKMPSVNQVLIIWKNIHDKIYGNEQIGYKDYNWRKDVTTKNMKPLAKHISGLELLFCKVGSYEHKGDNPRIIESPVICYGINCRVKDVNYELGSVKLIATSEHAFGMTWGADEYGSGIVVCFHEKEDAIAFINQINSQVSKVEDMGTSIENGKEVKIRFKFVKGYEEYGFRFIDYYNNKPEYENGWYSIRLCIY